MSNFTLRYSDLIHDNHQLTENKYEEEVSLITDQDQEEEVVTTWIKGNIKTKFKFWKSKLPSGLRNQLWKYLSDNQIQGELWFKFMNSKQRVEVWNTYFQSVWLPSEVSTQLTGTKIDLKSSTEEDAKYILNNPYEIISKIIDETNLADIVDRLGIYIKPIAEKRVRDQDGVTEYQIQMAKFEFLRQCLPPKYQQLAFWIPLTREEKNSMLFAQSQQTHALLLNLLLIIELLLIPNADRIQFNIASMLDQDEANEKILNGLVYTYYQLLIEYETQSAQIRQIFQSSLAIHQEEVIPMQRYADFLSQKQQQIQEQIEILARQVKYNTVKNDKKREEVEHQNRLKRKKTQNYY